MHILHITRLNIGYLFYPGMNWIEIPGFLWRCWSFTPGTWGKDWSSQLRVPDGEVDPLLPDRYEEVYPLLLNPFEEVVPLLPDPYEEVYPLFLDPYEEFDPLILDPYEEVYPLLLDPYEEVGPLLCVRDEEYRAGGGSAGASSTVCPCRTCAGLSRLRTCPGHSTTVPKSSGTRAELSSV